MKKHLGDSLLLHDDLLSAVLLYTLSIPSFIVNYFVKQYYCITNYHIEGNFGGGKVW